MTSVTAPDWQADVLGDGWSALTIELPPDRFGPAVATLVRRDPDRPTTAHDQSDDQPDDQPDDRAEDRPDDQPDNQADDRTDHRTDDQADDRTDDQVDDGRRHCDPGGARSRRAVLHVHGFTDYFFQRHLGDAFADAGWDFYALDLRDHGRSIRPGRLPNFTTDIGLYAAELDRAVALLRQDHDVVVIHGHSAGGLQTALWADDHPGAVDALVLDSPWLDHNGTRFERGPLTAILDVVGRVAPRLPVRGLSPHYGRALHVATGGEWDYDLTWKPHHSFPARAGWVRSIRAGHRRVARGLAVTVPVLVAASDASSPGDREGGPVLTTDVVVDVRDIAARAGGLGSDVTFVEVAGGTHDLCLSPSPARETYLAAVVDWLASRFPG